MTDLLEIPDFLKVGSAAWTKAKEDGRRQRAANPPVKPASPKDRRLSPTKRQQKRTKRSRDDVVRQQLRSLGYTPAFVASVGITKAKQLVADGLAGRGSTPEHLA